MSRSYRKTSCAGTTNSESEKYDKRLANRRFRRITNAFVEAGEFEDLPIEREVSNVWGFDKDGKRYFDAEKYPKAMRK